MPTNFYKMKMPQLLQVWLKLVMNKLLLLMHLNFLLKNKHKFRHKPKLKLLPNNKLEVLKLLLKLTLLRLIQLYWHRLKLKPKLRQQLKQEEMLNRPMHLPLKKLLRLV